MILLKGEQKQELLMILLKREGEQELLMILLKGELKALPLADPALSLFCFLFKAKKLVLLMKIIM